MTESSLSASMVILSVRLEFLVLGLASSAVFAVASGSSAAVAVSQVVRFVLRRLHLRPATLSNEVVSSSLFPMSENK